MKVTTGTQTPAISPRRAASLPLAPNADEDVFQARPFFADGVYATARAAQARIAAANRARIDEPIALARAVRDVYEHHPLVGILKGTLHELHQSRGYPVVFRFGTLPLVLSRRGFRTQEGHPIGERLAFAGLSSASAACRRLDAQLREFAEDPDRLAVAANHSMRLYEVAMQERDAAETEDEVVVVRYERDTRDDDSGSDTASTTTASTSDVVDPRTLPKEKRFKLEREAGYCDEDCLLWAPRPKMKKLGFLRRIPLFERVLDHAVRR